MTSPKCPYCQQSLEKKPARRTACPKCGNFIYVRQGELVTEEESKIRDELIRLESLLGVTRKEFDEVSEKLSKQFKTKAPINDVIWKILNKRMESLDIHVRIRALWEMARIAGREGRNTKPYLAHAHQIQLKEWQREGFTEVVIMNSGRWTDEHTCPKCRELHNTKYSIASALIEMPIPNNCERDYCRCSYEPVYETRNYP